MTRAFGAITFALVCSVAVNAQFVAVAAHAVTSGTNPGEAGGQLISRIEKLRKAAVGRDLPASDAAFTELKSLGQPAHKALLGALRQVLAKDKAAIQSAVANTGGARAAGNFAAVRKRVESTREAALDNLEDLRTGEQVRTARECHDRLVKDLPQFNAGLAARESLIRLTNRRAALLKVYREVAPEGDAEFSGGAEAKLLAAAETALGMPPEDAGTIPPLGTGEPPADPLLRHIWFYRACRDIEGYNESLRVETSKGEWDNFILVNRYREALGLLPFELDVRLVQSARRHSKEMHEQQYFSHQSPTPGMKRHGDRMRAAGYERGYSENIAAGPPIAHQTFEGWFDSPSHHRNMVHAASTAMGVGKWGRLWTQNMGTAPRLMLLPPAEREKASVLGTVLKPQR